MVETTSSTTLSEGSDRHVINQLAAVVRKIGWSYAILWSVSSNHPGDLTWGAGFYNGELKKMKFDSTADLNPERLKFHRSKQLKRLYDILVSCESVDESVSSLLPEEWYYMVSMSYVFRRGQGLPGRCFASNQYIWIYNAQEADSKTFLRRLLAKSSSIQTVLCIPLKNGALELGTTDLVMEGPDFVNRIIASLAESPLGPCLYPEEISGHSSAVRAETSFLNDIMTNATFSDVFEYECGGATMEQASRNLDDLVEFHSLEEDISTDCFISSPLPSPLRRSFMLSSFTIWKKPKTCNVQTSFVPRPPHNILLKVIAGSWRQVDNSRKSGHQENNIKKNASYEKMRREKINSMFQTLGSLVPSTKKVDKASILAETIVHLRELKRKLQELECTDNILAPSSTESETEMPRCPELTMPCNTDKARMKMTKQKRKAREMTGDDGSTLEEVNVRVVDKALQIELLCPLKEHVMSEVVHTVRRLNLEVVHVQASKSSALLRIKIKAQPDSSSTLAPELISEALLSALAG